MSKIIKTFLILILIGAAIFGGQKAVQKLVLENYPKTIEIVLGEPVVSLSPYTFTVNNNQMLRNIYEPLVRLDSSMNIKPSLAVSFGRIDDLTWEFRLTPNALFHSGLPLTTASVQHSFNELKKIANSQSLTDSIQEIQIIDDYNFRIKTAYSDPILLNKLALIPIIPSKNIEGLTESPDGTGPFIYKNHSEQTYTLVKNDNYYGRAPKFQELKFTAIPDREYRVQYANLNPDAALIAPFPNGLTPVLDENRFNLVRYPNLSVNFFLFNFRTSVFDNLELRQLLTKSLTDENLRELTDEIGHPTDQFVSSGVLGFDASLNIEKLQARELELAVKNQGFFGTEFNIALPEGLEVFRDFLDDYWFEAGLRPEIAMLPLNELTEGSTLAQYDLIFLGWKSDFGGASQFIQSFALPNSEFNLGDYSNEQVNQLAESIKQELDLQTRRDLLAETMKILTQDDPMGIPLFESEVLFAVNKKFKYTPRADGLIDVKNLKPKLAN